MRDPAALLRLESDCVVRELRVPLVAAHFLRSPLAREWVARGDLVPFEVIDDSTLSAVRLPFVSLPTEWCDVQLYQAAELTLRLQREAVQAGYELKDASAWNILFDGGRPMFCDLLSFEHLARRPWWAAGQFARNFILPLLLSQRRGLRAHKSFLAWRDGVPHEVARDMLGPGRFLTRYWPLMAGDMGRARSQHSERLPGTELDEIQSFRANLHHSLEWMLAGVNPHRSRPDPTTWQNYVGERSHYSDQDLQFKRQQVHAWLNLLSPSWVLDLGCNSGEFSRIAAGDGASVIAVDADHGAIQRGVAEADDRIHWLVAALDDLRGGYGWAGAEHAGLPERMRRSADMTLMLALIHHLVVGASIPLTAVAQFAAHCSRRWLVIELIAPDDVQVALMQSQRNRVDPFPGMAQQLQALAVAGFTVREQHPLPSGTRVLALLELRA